MKHRRQKTIPDRLFHRLWDSCRDMESQDQYVQRYLSPLSEDFIDFFRKYDIAELASRQMLINIYQAYHMSFRDIITSASIKPSEVSHIFCIPIRTIEEWSSGKNRCPGYIRLMLLRHFYLLDLGKYIAIESELKRRELKPYIYKVADRTTDIETAQSPANMGVDDISESYASDNTISKKAYATWLDDLEQINSSSPAEDILKRTEYLKSRIKPGNKNKT